MKRQKTTASLNELRLAARSTLSGGKRPALVFGLCRPGLMIVTVAYDLLAVAAFIAVICPHAVHIKLAGLVAYCMLSGVFTHKVYKAWCSKGRTRA